MDNILLLICFIHFSLVVKSQVVEETIQLDTITKKIKVIYRPSYTHPTTHYTKKIGVFPDDTSQIAIEKTYIRNQLNGIYKVYYPSGQLMVKAVFANDKHNGEFTWYQPNGIIKVKGIYKNDIKHQFWAYKYLKIYGRYKNGKRHKRWYKVDANNKKIKSRYRHGKLIKGKGFEYKDKNDVIPNLITLKDTNSVTLKDKKSETSKVQSQPQTLSKELEQVVAYLKSNFVLRKTLKQYFGEKNRDLWKFKRNYKSEAFQFNIHKDKIQLDIYQFVEQSKNGLIKVTAIDSILKNTSDIQAKFSTSLPNNTIDLSNLSNSKTSKKPLITVYFSAIINQLMRIEVVWNKDREIFEDEMKLLNNIKSDKKFSILLYFNKDGKLAGATYQNE